MTTSHTPLPPSAYDPDIYPDEPHPRRDAQPIDNAFRRGWIAGTAVTTGVLVAGMLIARFVGGAL